MQRTLMQRTLHCHALEGDVGERADVVLGRRIPGLSRRQARVLGLAGKLRIDGRRQPPSTRVGLGQQLALEFEEPEPSALAELEPLAITDDFVYVVKPSGVHTVAITPDQPGVLATAVAARWPECAAASEDPREGGAIHRLDFPTSGVVAFARSREVWQRARAGFGEGRVSKLYLAVCQPQPASGILETWPPALPAEGLRGWIEPAGPLEFPPTPGSPSDRLLSLDPVRVRAPIGKCPDKVGRVAVRLEGRRASSVVQPIAESRREAGPTWLVRVRLETGLRHQARVHLAWIGLPIVGDVGYAPDFASEHAPESASEPAHPPPMIRLHAFMLDLSVVFPGEQPRVANPDPEFWPS